MLRLIVRMVADVNDTVDGINAVEKLIDKIKYNSSMMNQELQISLTKLENSETTDESNSEVPGRELGLDA